MIRLARFDRGFLTVAARDQFGKVRHDIASLGLSWLMAPLTLSLKQRPDFFVITDLVLGASFLGCVGK